LQLISLFFQEEKAVSLTCQNHEKIVARARFEVARADIFLDSAIILARITVSIVCVNI
jgi:hypothetical protein